MSDPLGGTTIPLSGQSLVEGKDLRATVTWYTVNDIALTGITLHWAGAENEAGDTEMLGRTLSMLSDGLKDRGVQLRWVQDTLLDATDEYLEAIAGFAGFAEHPRQVVLRSRLDAGSNRAASSTTGETARALDVSADSLRWKQLLDQTPGVTGSSVAPPSGTPDRVTVVAAESGDLTAFCWARTARSAPGAPATAEVFGLGSLPGEGSGERRRAALDEMKARLAEEGIRTLSMATDEHDDQLQNELVGLGFTPRRQRRVFSATGI